MSEPRLVKIGKIGRPHGTQGEVRLFLFNPDSELLEVGQVLSVHVAQAVKGSPDVQELVVESVRPSNKFQLVKFKGLRFRDEVDRLKNCEVSAPYEDFPELEDDEFYHVDVVGLPVVVALDESLEEHRSFGVVDRFFDTGADDVMVVKDPDGKEYFVPMIEDAIETIDLVEGKVYLMPFEDWTPAEKG